MPIKSGASHVRSKSGVLYDALTGANYVFHSLKPLCKVLGLNYVAILRCLHKEVFYRDRFYTNFCSVPKECGTALENLSKII